MTKYQVRDLANYVVFAIFAWACLDYFGIWIGLLLVCLFGSNIRSHAPILESIHGAMHAILTYQHGEAGDHLVSTAEELRNLQ